MVKLQNRKEVNKLTLLLLFTYMISYITRINYGAIISEMESAAKMSKSLLSMALTGSFITYGAGQIISGIITDRYSPKKLVSYGITATALINLLIPLCTNHIQMLALWSINGFAQAFMWPPIVRLMTAFLSEDDYKTATTKVSWGSSIGTIIVYLLSPVLISLFSWKSVFIFSGLCAIGMLLIWNKKCMDIDQCAIKSNVHKTGLNLLLLNPLILFIMIAIILQGILRDGVTTWMPSYIAETYKISNLISILTGVLLPVFSIFYFSLSTALYKKRFKNPVLCAGVFFGAGVLFAALLFSTSGRNAAISVICSAILTGCMHGVNLMLICMIPPFFEKYKMVATVSGILNSCTYIGSALSSYVIALLAEKYGWNVNLLIWLITAVLGTIICLFCSRPWRQKYMDSE